MKDHWSILVLLLMMFLTSISGCFGKEIVYASNTKAPEEAIGAIRIATNMKIPVTVEGETTTQSFMDLGGYYAVHAKDLKTFIEAVKSKKQ